MVSTWDARLGVLALLVWATPACTTDVDTDPSTHQGAADETARGAVLVWRPDAGATGEDTAFSNANSPSLWVTEVRSDEHTLYVDFVHRGAEPEATHPAEPTRLASLALNGCPEPVPPVRGQVVRDSSTPSTSTIELADLPDGDLDLVFVVFDLQRTLPLHKDGIEVSYLREEDRIGAAFTPADPQTGQAAVLSLPVPNCER